ncbi:MAG: hypothetical protein JXA37_01120 [Chloroflexia bacterium]|nr:hypothetical protein [Chloroflexia bacterium]
MTQVNAELAAIIRSRLREQRLPCAEAFAIAREQGYSPQEVAAAAEALDVRLGWCQLGLFGVAKGPTKEQALSPEQLAPELRQQIESAQEEGTLSCAQAWAIARRLERSRSEVGQAVDALGIHIIHCQLGCF